MTSISRSYLFVPGNRADRIAKARAAGPHAVIVDLEDAVAPTDKAAARTAVSQALSAEHPVLLRVNGPGTPWHDDDLALCKSPGVAGILLPKTEEADHVRHAASRLGSQAFILPIIETAAGFANAGALAKAARVQRLAFGTIDFQLDLGIDGEEDELLFFRSRLVLESRLAGIQSPVDGVTVALDDPEALRRETLRSKRLGFGAKLCIHPKQVAVVNECFTPTAEEIAWAKRIVEAANKAGGAAVAVDGKMVDKPVILKAQEILAAK
ncbi:MAG TPA: CoA ester lyase [Burkholderiales bacterium]|nr:CoA ester lyase [Burkholderiales bacterium]